MDAGLPSQRLVAILAADAAEYSRLMSLDEQATLTALNAARGRFRTETRRNGGRVIDMAGDSVLAIFETAQGALRAALAIQEQLGADGALVPERRRLRFRIGVHLGDVVQKRDRTVYGDGVNIAARLQGIADAGGIVVSESIRMAVRNKGMARFECLGERSLKNIAEPILVHRLLPAESSPQKVSAAADFDLSLADKPSVTGLAEQSGRPGPTRGRIRTNLPQILTSFVGRDIDITKVKRLLARNRLVTLTGIGGIGKTRVALKVAADVVDSYPDGVWLVEFGSIDDPRLVPASVAQLLGIQERPGEPLTQTLCRHLESRRLLLVLETCEHVLDDAAAFVATLLSETPNVDILLTSREALNIDGEQRVPLTPLSLPSPDPSLEIGIRAEAVQLFVERARLQQSDFLLAEHQAPTVAAICRRLDGLPLAIELAAARTSSLSIDEINRRLDDRFKLLAGGLRVTPRWQRTLRATFDWSYLLLAEDEQRMLPWLATFAGSFTVEAAHFVFGDSTTDDLATVDLLSRFVARSLLVAELNGNSTRYRLLGTTRAYLTEKLDAAGERACIMKRQAQYFRDRFECAFEDWIKLSDAQWNAAYLPERDNVRASIDWASSTEGERDIAIALVANCGPAWLLWSLRSEGLQRLEAALASCGSLTPKKTRARLWLWLGVLRQFRDPVESVRALRRSVVLHRKVGDSFGAAYSLTRLGLSLARTGHMELAQESLDAALPLLNHCHVPTAMAPYFYVSSFVRKSAGDLVGARDYCQKALSLYRAAGADQSARDMTGSLADTNWALGALDAALAGFREIIDAMRTSDRMTTLGLGVALTNLAGVLTELGHLEEALAYAREGLALRRDSGYVWGALDHLALRAALSGKREEAARLAGYVDSVFGAKKELRQSNEARARARLNQVLNEELSPDEFKRLLGQGASITEDEAYQLALSDS